MAEAWTAPCRELVVDRSARSTFANVRARRARVARRGRSRALVLVTSGWHGRRAPRTLLRARALRRPAGTVDSPGDHRAKRPSVSTPPFR
jgi:uncharacterized SAM-binding protein YcdF (DUF218 family)